MHWLYWLDIFYVISLLFSIAHAQHGVAHGGDSSGYLPPLQQPNTDPAARLENSNSPETKTISMKPHDPLFQQTSLNGSAEQMSLGEELTLKQGNWWNTHPAVVTDPLLEAVFLSTPLPGMDLLSGDWVSIQSVKTSCFLHTSRECITGQDPDCDLHLRGATNASSDDARYQLFVSSWNSTTLNGYVALKDYLGRWVTTTGNHPRDGHDVAYVQQKQAPSSFADILTSALNTFYLTKDMAGTDGYFRMYRNWSNGADGRTESFRQAGRDRKEEGCESSLWTIGTTGDDDKNTDDVRIEIAEPPSSVAPIEEKLLNTRFFVKSLQRDAAPAYVAFASACNAATVQQTVMVTYLFTSQAVIMVETARTRTVGQTYGLKLSAPKVQSMMMLDWSFQIDTTWKLTMTKGTSIGWWNMTNDGQTIWLYLSFEPSERQR